MARTLTRRRTARDTEAYSPADEPEDNNLPEDDEEEKRPARGSRRGSRRESLHTEEAPTSRRSRRPARDEDDDEDEDNEPTPKVGGKGWGSYEKTKSASSGFPDDFKVTDEEVLIKILDDEPFLVFLQHWIERQGKKSFTCLEVKCPLCDDTGDKPSQQVCFNIVDFTDPDDPQVKVWRFGPMVGDMLKNFAKNKRTAPINREDLYWSVRKERKQKKTTYYIQPVKEHDLESDWDTEPLSDADLDKFEKEAYDEGILQVSTRTELRTIAREILND